MPVFGALMTIELIWWMAFVAVAAHSVESVTRIARCAVVENETVWHHSIRLVEVVDWLDSTAYHISVALIACVAV